MSGTKRRQLLLLGVIAGSGLSSTALLAQSAPGSVGGFPSKTVRIIVPFPPGQAADIFARLLAEKLQVLWGQNVIVENKAGGGGVPGVEAGRTAPADGYTMLMGTSGTLGINPVVYTKLPYDAQKDFAPASNVFIAPLVLVAHPSLASDSLAGVIDYIKKNPGKLNYASAGPGTAQHMAAELFKSRAGLFMVHIPYRGSGPAMTDLLGGQIPMMFDSVTSALPHITSGRLRPIAVTTRTRVESMPNVPAIAELIPNFEAVGWSGIVLPKDTAVELVAKISNDIQKILNDPQTKAEIARRGSIADPLTPKAFADFIAAENRKWREVAKIANVKLD